MRLDLILGPATIALWVTFIRIHGTRFVIHVGPLRRATSLPGHEPPLGLLEYLAHRPLLMIRLFPLVYQIHLGTASDPLICDGATTNDTGFSGSAWGYHRGKQRSTQ